MSKVKVVFEDGTEEIVDRDSIWIFDKTDPFDNKKLFDYILAGGFDKNGYKIYRVFRDEYGEILKCVYIREGVFIEVELPKLLTCNQFTPEEEWKKNVGPSKQLIGEFPEVEKK